MNGSSSTRPARSPAAARTKARHHRERLVFWSKKTQELMTRIRKEGLEITEPVAQHTTMRAGPTVMVRNDLHTQLQECVRKEREHTSRVREYEGWVQVLKANPKVRLRLQHDDWLHFFGKPVILPDASDPEVRNDEEDES